MVQNPSLHFTIEKPLPEDDAAIEALLDHAFGPGRFTKTAYRIRELAGLDPDLNFIARGASGLVGSIAFAPVRIGGKEARLLGPLAVAPEYNNKGIGKGLIDHGVRAVFESGCEIVILVGDREYYARSGFVPVPFGQVSFPGPVDPMRIVWKASRDRLLDGVSGELTPFTIPGRGKRSQQQGKAKEAREQGE